ncbi:hypothetical protein E4T42_06178 [Aureobasidium subglaciale]|nr:hypothetical protein E4T42_06178 [Aureobasidium subglaciale]
MRFSSYALPALAANLVAALPAPQEIDLDMVVAAPDPTYTQVLDATAQVVTYDTTAILAEATAAASSVEIAVTDVLQGTAIVSKRDVVTSSYDEFIGAWVTPAVDGKLEIVADATEIPDSTAAATSTAAAKRDVVARAACTTLPSGVAAYALSSDTASDFRANASFASIASAAPVPSGYVNTVLNGAGANSAYGYLGYFNLKSYDTNACAAKCSSTVGCMAFNVYLERDPSVDPGTGDTGCANPASVVYAKCAMWGGPLTTANAVNTGQMRNKFEVAVTASNSYQNTSLAIPAGFKLNAVYNTNAINAPYDAQGYNTYMGATIFSKGPFNIQLCADYCTAQTAYNAKNPANDGSPPKVCTFFNTYILYLNNASTPQGQYCSLYTETWDSTYATNTGQNRGSDRYFVGYSYTFSNAISQGVPPKQGDKKGAIYQAAVDMKYDSSSLSSVFQPFCTSVLGYSNPLVTATALTTITPIVSSTVMVTSTVTANANGKRAASSSLSTPAVLTKYPASVVASACSLIATSPTGTSTVTGATSIATAAAQTTLVTQVSTVTVAAAPAIKTGYLQARGGGIDGQWLNTDYNSRIPAFGSSPRSKVFCTLGEDRVLTCNNAHASIYGSGLFFQIIPLFAKTVSGWTLKCDSDSTGLLTCDKTTTFEGNGAVASGQYGSSWATCKYLTYGNTLNYFEHSSVAASCQKLTGLYLV